MRAAARSAATSLAGHQSRFLPGVQGVQHGFQVPRKGLEFQDAALLLKGRVATKEQEGGEVQCIVVVVRSVRKRV